MRDLVRTLVLSAVIVGGSSAARAAEPKSDDTATPASVGGETPSWAGEASRPGEAQWGFAPLSVTRDGVVYSTTPPAVDPAASDQPKIADLPAWATSRFSIEPDRRQTRSPPFDALPLGSLGFGALPEPAAWALILIGTAMICGALRGLIMAHRRLERLRAEDETAD